MRRKVLCFFPVFAWGGAVSAQPRTGNPKLPSALRFRRVVEPKENAFTVAAKADFAVMRGSNEWKYRWVIPPGEEVYSNAGTYDPNFDSNTNRTDFKRSAVRQRP